MPVVPPDLQLLERLNGLVSECGENQSEAARRLGVERGKVNRVLRGEGRVTKRVAMELTRALNRAGMSHPDLDPKTKQTDQTLSRLACQVAQFIAETVERRVRQEHP